MCVARNPPWATHCSCVSSISNHGFTQAQGGDPAITQHPPLFRVPQNSSAGLQPGVAPWGPHLQGGELAHVGEGGVAQGADLVVAQIAGKQKPQG